MAKTKKQTEIDKIYIVVSEEENKFFTSFSEAETYAKDVCEENDEEIQIFEVHKAWDVYYPVEPEPESSERSLVGLIE
jgi:hypothetical protein